MGRLKNSATFSEGVLEREVGSLCRTFVIPPTLIDHLTLRFTPFGLKLVKNIIIVDLLQHCLDSFNLQESLGDVTIGTVNN